MVADRLAPRELLGDLPATTELVDVAKLPRGRSARQEEINRLIVERALAGQRVVRFKGGDSFVFGRGFEEVEACRAAGVPVHVIPGLSSPLAVPAVAGIPVTHRGVAHEFTVVSGHLPPGHADSLVDWDALARLRGTLLLMMAVENAPRSPQALLAAGRAGAHAGRRRLRRHHAGERTVLSTLGDLAADLDRHAVRPPAIIVVGDVVAVAHPRHTSAGGSRPWQPDRGHRPGRPAARRLPRPARRPAAHAPRGRARAVPRRGREGRTPGGRGRLHAAVVPDGAALARRARRRARPDATRPATS